MIFAAVGLSLVSAVLEVLLFRADRKPPAWTYFFVACATLGQLCTLFALPLVYPAFLDYAWLVTGAVLLLIAGAWAVRKLPRPRFAWESSRANWRFDVEDAIDGGDFENWSVRRSARRARRGR